MGMIPSGNDYNSLRTWTWPLTVSFRMKNVVIRYMAIHIAIEDGSFGSSNQLIHLFQRVMFHSYVKICQRVYILLLIGMDDWHGFTLWMWWISGFIHLWIYGLNYMALILIPSSNIQHPNCVVPTECGNSLLNHGFAGVFNIGKGLCACLFNVFWF